MILGGFCGICLAVGLVLGLDQISDIHHAVDPVASSLMGGGCAGLGALIGKGTS